MSDTLFGKEVSGTALETRGLAQDVASQFQNLVRDPSGGAKRIAATFGIDPSQLGLQDFTQSVLSGQTDLSGFDAANRPFQQRAMRDASSQMSGQFGTAGGRFSRNLLSAQGAQQGEMAAQFNRDRFNFGQQKRGQDVQAMMALFQSLPGLQNAAMAPLTAAGQYANPGAPIWQEGMLGDIISAGAQIGGAYMGKPPTPAQNPFAGGAGSQRGYTPANPNNNFWQVDPNFYSIR